MRKAVFIPLVLFLGVILVQAQSDCGNGLPCGPLPWRVPNLPPLPSPTRIPTIAVTNQAANPANPTPTPPPNPTAFFDTAQLQGQVATLQAVIAATQIPIQDIQGTPVNATAIFNEMAENTDTFFSYAKGVAGLDLGILTPLLGFLFTSMVGVILVKLFTFALPVILGILGLIRRVYHVIMDFMPF